MRRLISTCTGWALLALLVVPETLWAAAAKVDSMVIVADTRKLGPWAAWWANLYNESHVYFTLVTVIAVPVIGLIFGVLADLVMGHIGIDLKSRELAEH
uniref:Uncharacterized protein n=1 Tax=Desulfobacca acetoxidans TaxID=60893 RepID=A0A7V4GA81_9BACT